MAAFQVPVCKSYLDPLSLATWMCLLATLQCAAMALFLEPNNYLEIWKLNSLWEFPCILYGVSLTLDSCSGAATILRCASPCWIGVIEAERILQGVFASGANFFLQSWCIAVKGPLYSAIFTPLSAVITATLSTLFLHEQLHVGRYACFALLCFHCTQSQKSLDKHQPLRSIGSSDTTESLLVQRPRCGYDHRGAVRRAMG